MNDRTTFAALKVLVDAQRFILGVNLTSANTPGSPGYRGFENLFAVLGTIAAVAFCFMVYGWMIGLVSVPFGIVAFLTAGRVIQKRAGNRIRRWALSSPVRFLAMWEGGIVSVKDAQSGKSAISARGDDLGEFVFAGMTEILAKERDPVSKTLEAAFGRLESDRNFYK